MKNKIESKSCSMTFLSISEDKEMLELEADGDILAYRKCVINDL